MTNALHYGLKILHLSKKTTFSIMTLLSSQDKSPLLDSDPTCSGMLTHLKGKTLRDSKVKTPLHTRMSINLPRFKAASTTPPYQCHNRTSLRQIVFASALTGSYRSTYRRYVTVIHMSSTWMAQESLSPSKTTSSSLDYQKTS